jgi:hypothetical protein
VEGFSATTYTGNVSGQYIGGVGFQPDLVWLKSRTYANNHGIWDSIRGVGSRLKSNATDAEDSVSLVSLDNDGFTLGTDYNASGENLVAWCWDAGSGSPVSNTDGSITSTVKANPDRGFSIVSWTGTGSAATIGHGLSSAPEMVIIKNRSTAQNWNVYHTDVGTTNILSLDLTSAAFADGAAMINSTAPTSSVVSLGFGGASNQSGSDHIAYCFHSVSGYSKMGSYTGTGASGNTVTTGFKPAFVMVKRTDVADNWHIHDSTRNPVNPVDKWLYPNLSNAEADVDVLSFDSNGFTISSTANSTNASGGTYIYMAFADTREAAFWLDDSGNNNDWENNGLTESDISLDSPTNNFATLNPLDSLNGTTYFVLSEGNLRRTYSPSGSDLPAWSTFSLSSGKWYFETACITNGYLGDRFRVGVTNGKTFDSVGNNANSYGYAYDGNKYNNSSGSAYGSTYTEGDIIGTALDLDAGTLTFYKNGVSQGTAFTGLSGEFFFGMAEFQSSVMVANFGQDSSFAGNKVPQGYTDANGIGDFYYAPPAGYLALCTANLPEPAIGPNSATTSDGHFNTVLYTGDGTDDRSISGVGFQPDFTWLKARSAAQSHELYDVLRQNSGNPARLQSDNTGAESAAPNNLQAFESDGFQLGDATSVNGSGTTMTAWLWKANGSGVSNTDGSITSTVSANVDAGFSIVSYAGNGSNATVGHGLSQAPDMMIVKNRDDGTRSWITYHKDNTSAPETDFLRLDATNATADYPVWNDTAPTSSVFSVGDASTNGSGNGIIAYCFHSVEGFSKFGSYTGNGSADGPFVYTGFRPAWVMVKRTDSSSAWFIWDGSRDPDNYVGSELYAHSSAAEPPSYESLDFTSNGFKLRASYSDRNGSGGTYIYMAFAENPFKYSNAR